MTDIRDVLAGKLNALGVAGMVDLARSIDVNPRAARDAAKGLPISADHFLRLAAAVGLDPMTGAAIAPRVVGALDLKTLGAAIQITLGLHGNSKRAAAKATGLSAMAIVRLIRGERVSIDTLMRACRHFGTDAFGYCACETGASVSRQTCAVTPTTTPSRASWPLPAEGGDA